MATLGEIIEKTPKQAAIAAGVLGASACDLATYTDGVWHQLDSVVKVLPLGAEKAYAHFADSGFDYLGAGMIVGSALKGDPLIKLKKGELNKDLRFYQRLNTTPMWGMASMLAVEAHMFCAKYGYDVGYRWEQMFKDVGKDVLTGLALYGLFRGIRYIIEPKKAAPVAAAPAAPVAP